MSQLSVNRLGPVLRPHDCPYPCTLAFNAGVVRLPEDVGGSYAGRWVMVFRNDSGDFGQPEGWPGDRAATRTTLGIATSDDGLDWSVEDRELWDQSPTAASGPGVRRRYDPRLSVLDLGDGRGRRIFLSYAVDTWHGTRPGLAVTDDLHQFEELSLGLPDNRNTVLFPRLVDGKLLRLERPFPMYLNPRAAAAGGHAFDVWIGESHDGGRSWGGYSLVLGREQLPWVNDKIGPGAPPIETDAGWLCALHAVDLVDQDLVGWGRKPWRKRYSVAFALLDLHDPRQVIGISRQPALDASQPYEKQGFRGSVLFPGGFVDLGDGTARLYYGAADTVEAAAEVKIADVLQTLGPPDPIYQGF